MNVLVDTCIWSLALRRNQENGFKEAEQLKDLIMDSRAMMMGAVRQELLSGISKNNQFARLKKHLSAFPDIVLNESDYELGAEYFNICRKKGIQGSNTDFLISSVSVNRNMPIYTVDQDFILFKKHLPITLYE
jgi:predicted nucleic acid-binding protein